MNRTSSGVDEEVELSKLVVAENEDSALYHNSDVDKKKKNHKAKYPKHVFLIIGNEFCERFSYYGMRTVLVLYVRNFLGFGDDDATTLFHAFTMLAYFTPLMGGIISDSMWGKYKTIIILSIVYIAGHGFKTVAAIPYIPHRSAHITLSVIGLLLIAVGTGGIKPCVSSFGGDQFQSGQDVYRKQFFSLFYFTINAGALLAKIIMPIFRADLKCFPGEDGPLFEECYSVAFGLPGILMIIALVLLVFGSSKYTKTPPSGSIFLRFCKCIYSACKNRWNTKPAERNKAHWVDYADATSRMKRDTKYVLGVLVIFSPLPLFWALFDQQGSRWTLQALQMDRYWGSYLIKPEQMDTINPILIVTLIPLFEATLYPLLRHYKIPFTSIRKMGAGLILAGLSFIVTAMVQFEIDKTLTPLPSTDQFAVRIINTSPHIINFKSDHSIFDALILKPNEVSKTQTEFMETNEWKFLNLTYSIENKESSSQSISIAVKPSKITEVVISGEDADIWFQSDLLSKQPEDGSGIVGFVNSDRGKYYVKFDDDPGLTMQLEPMSRSRGIRLPVGSNYYFVYDIGETGNNTKEMLFKGEVDIKLSGIYSVVLISSKHEKKNIHSMEYENANQIEDVNHFRVSVAWMIPQYVLITVGEVFLSVTGLEFAYTQAPPNMKSVMTSFWLLTISLGNVIVIMVAQMKSIKRQAHEFLLFAGLIAIASIVFIYLGRRYTPVDEDEFEKDKIEDAEEDVQI
ncbi:solute carrier family 15 member 2-like isoform X1 [Styela clava]